MKVKKLWLMPVCYLVCVGHAFSESATLEEVIVTATKREQNLRDVPMAVTAVDRNFIEKNEVNSIENLTAVVPSLRLSRDGFNTNSGSINIRGVGTNVYSIAVEPNVAVMVDGVVLSRNSMAGFDFADIERIEVLKGPQGTLFGKNASAGLVHVITRDPSSEFEGRIRSSYEELQDYPGSLWKTQASVSGPLNDKMGIRVTGYRTKTEGHVEDVAQHNHNPDTDQYGFRVKHVWDISDDLSTHLNLEYQNRDAAAVAVPQRGANPDLEQRNGTITASKNNRQATTTGDNQSDLESAAASFSINWSLGDSEITSISSYREADITTNQTIKGLYGNRVDLNATLSQIEISTVTQELKFSSNIGNSVEYTAGALWFYNEISEDYYRDVDDLAAEFVVGTAAPGLFPPGALDNFNGMDALRSQLYRYSKVETSNLGIYLEGTWDILESLHLTIGGRYINEQVDVGLSSTDILGYSTTGQELQRTDYLYREATVGDKTFTGRVSLLHDLNDKATVYASISSGYRGVAFDVTAGDSYSALEHPVEPEESVSYEVGYKARIFDNRVDVNLTAFLTRIEHFQAQLLDLENPAALSYRLANAGELETRGVELEFTARPTASLLIAASFLYNPTEYLDFQTACFVGQRPGEAAGQDLDGDGTCDVQDVKGGVLANAPEYSGTMSIRYDYDFQRGDTVYGMLTGRWQDEVQFTNEQHPNGIEDPVGILNFRLGWIGLGSKFEIAAYVKNIFDKMYTGRITPVSLVNDRRDSLHYVPFDAARVFGGSVVYRF